MLSMLSNGRSGRLRPLIIVAVLVAWFAVGGLGGAAQGKLSQVQTNDAAAYLPIDAESVRAATANRVFVDTKTLPVLVVLRAEDSAPLTPAQLGAVQTWVGGLAGLAVPGAAASAGDPTDLGAALTSPAVAVPAQDGKAVLVPLALDATTAARTLADGTGTTLAVVDALRTSLSSDLGATATSAGALGLRAWVTGPGGFVADLVTAFGGIDGVLLAVALGAVLLILVVVYRSPFLPLAVILSAVFALSAAALVVYQLAAAGRLTLNGQAQGIMSILVVGASVDYALLLVSRYREELHHTALPATAMGRALRASVAPIAASAGTVMAALLCLLLSDLASNRSLGPVGAIAIASAFLASMTFLPALLLVAGRRSRILFWPRRPTMLDDAAEAGAVSRSTDAVLVGPWGRVARFVGRHARPVWIGTAVLLAVGAAFVPTLKASGTSQTAVYLTPVDSVAGEAVLAAHFPAGDVQPAIVIVPEASVAAVTKAATAVPGVDSATPYTGSQAGGPPAAGAAAKVVDGTVRVDVVTAAPADSQEAVRTVTALRTAVHAVAPSALVGGAAAEQLDTQLAGERDLRVIVPVVLLVILVILMLLLRSLTAALLLVVANVLSFAAALGVSAIVFNHVLHFPGADPTVPLFGFAFLIALGVDYSIFLMTRVREESLQVGTRDGVLRGLAVTGGVITSAGVVLAATFAALGVIPLLFLAQLAFIVAFGVLVDTLLVRTLLVPAVVHELGARTWWPSALARRG